MRSFHCMIIAIVGISAVCGEARADERLKDIACRSVHLAYSAPAGSSFYNELTVERSAPGTYFCVCGWSKGYFGLQQLSNDKKLLIFSVWDSDQNDPAAIADGERVKLLHKMSDVRIGRFGGEGTGGQSFYDFDWKVGETYRFLVTATIDGARTAYSGYFYHPERAQWLHLVTFSTITGGRSLQGHYSFVEDFQRDRASTTKARIARFGNGWIIDESGRQQPIAKARFTADRNPVLNINAGLSDDRFFLATGGDTENVDTQLNALIELPGESHSAPTDLPPPNVANEPTP